MRMGSNVNLEFRSLIMNKSSQIIQIQISLQPLICRYQSYGRAKFEELSKFRVRNCGCLRVQPDCRHRGPRAPRSLRRGRMGGRSLAAGGAGRPQLHHGLLGGRGHGRLQRHHQDSGLVANHTSQSIIVILNGNFLSSNKSLIFNPSNFHQTSSLLLPLI